MKTRIFDLCALAIGLAALAHGTFAQQAAGEQRAPISRIVFAAHMDGHAAALMSADRALVFVGPSGIAAATGGAASGSGDVFTVSWRHQDPVTGQCRDVTVSYERRRGQSIPAAAAEFNALVQQSLDWYPPNCAQASASGIVIRGGAGADVARGPLPWSGILAASGGPASDGDVMSISWKHDPDEDGPLHPVTVTASTERRASESSSQQARRLRKMAQELMDVFPPNVPADGS